MPEAFNEVVILRDGDPEGNRMVVKLTTEKGVEIFAIAVPQDWPSRTGPTWTYLFENDGLTLIDVGATGSTRDLVEGIECAGFKANDIERVIITHGHADHDGGVKQFAEETGAEVWAHDIYAYLLPYNPWEIQRRPASLVQQEMHRITEADRGRNDSREGSNINGYRSRHYKYIEARKELNVQGRIKAGDQLGQLTFMHAPGHSPDELCVTLDGIVFTGDHVLPEITPHPTTKTKYTAEIRDRLPDEYHHEDSFYGLETYIKSLQMVVDLGPEVAVLPAHRLFNKNKFNFQTVQRATDVIDHHASRLNRILRRVGSEPTALEEVTRGIFARRALIGGNLYAALSEIVAHIELLEDSGDIEFTDDRKLRWKGTENFRELIRVK